MRSKIEPAKLEDLLDLFEDVVQPEDIMYAKISSQASRSIAKERLRLNMNQKEFADYTHSQQSLISRWESGDYNFSLRKLSEISVALDMNLHIFMTPRCLQKQLFSFPDTTICSGWTNVHKMQPKIPAQKKLSYCTVTVYSHSFSEPLHSDTFCTSNLKEALLC